MNDARARATGERRETWPANEAVSRTLIGELIHGLEEFLSVRVGRPSFLFRVAIVE